jgi:hypothetical protein
MQGSNRSSQEGTISINEIDDAKRFVAAAREALTVPTFEVTLRPKVESDLALIEAETAKPEPNWKLLRAIGSSTRAIIESGLGGVLTTALTGIHWPHA